jgi:hypothetical protein
MCPQKVHSVIYTVQCCRALLRHLFETPFSYQGQLLNYRQLHHISENVWSITKSEHWSLKHDGAIMHHSQATGMRSKAHLVTSCPRLNTPQGVNQESEAAKGATSSGRL